MNSFFKSLIFVGLVFLLFLEGSIACDNSPEEVKLCSRLDRVYSASTKRCSSSSCVVNKIKVVMAHYKTINKVLADFNEFASPELGEKAKRPAYVICHLAFRTSGSTYYLNLMKEFTDVRNKTMTYLYDLQVLAGIEEPEECDQVVRRL